MSGMVRKGRRHKHYRIYMNDYIKQVCKIGQGAACCKYLGGGVDGLECLKINPAFKGVIDEDWTKTQHVAQGDNCEGQKNLKTAEIIDNEKK